MRHGEAHGSPDIARQLTEEGHIQCARVGAAFLTNGFTPDFILCSGLDRTRQSLSSLSFPEVPSVFCGEDLYRAGTAREILNIMGEFIPKDVKCPLVIGHNPTIHETVAYLCRETISAYSRLVTAAYPPATASVFSFDGDDWDMLHPAMTRLVHVISGGE